MFSKIFGIKIKYSFDHQLPILCYIIQENYGIEEGCKIEWEAIDAYKDFGRKSFYQSDFDQLWAEGTIKVYIEEDFQIDA